MSLFDTRDISPMLIGAESEAFDSPDYTYELKLDGVRCLAFLDPDGSVELRNKRNLLVSPIYPELSGINKQVKGRCVLDGELTVIVDGKPQFSEIQRRALMSDPFKIKLAATKFPVNFTAFDILYDGKDLMAHPLEDRQERLKQAVRESDRLAVTRVIEGQGKVLYALTEQQGLEGIVAKRKGSLYHPGKRTKDWVKCKNLLDDDFVVCGYIRKGQGMTSIVLGQYRGGELVYKGHVTLGVAGGSYRRITSLPALSAPPYPVPAGNENAVWIEPRLVCTVKFMERTANGGMRQPVFKGLRDDKDALDCIAK